MYFYRFGQEDSSYFDNKPDVLQYLEVQTISFDRCKKYYEFKPQQRHMHNTTVCTIGKRRDGPCNGDSGMIIIYKIKMNLVIEVMFSIDFKIMKL